MLMDRLQGHLCGDFWLGWASSGYSGTRLLCLETQLCLIPDGSPSMDLGINLLTPQSCNVCFTAGSCWTGCVITPRDSVTQAPSGGGVLDVSSLQSNM